MSDQVSSAAVLAALARIEDNQSKHADRLDGVEAKLTAHDRLIAATSNQLASHSAMLLKHAELHTKHAEAIAAAKESAREAKQSSSDLAKEWKDAASAIDRHVKTGLAGVHSEMTQAKTERALQTTILRQLASVVPSVIPARQLALAATIGAFFGGLLFGVGSAVVSHFFGGHP